MIKEAVGAITSKQIQFDHGTSLKVARAIFGVGTREMAKEFGVGPSAINKWENTRRWNAERVSSVSEFFGMTEQAFTSMAQRALSEAVSADRQALNDHLTEYHPRHSKQTKQIMRHYDKIHALLREIEGVE